MRESRERSRAWRWPGRRWALAVFAGASMLGTPAGSIARQEPADKPEAPQAPARPKTGDVMPQGFMVTPMGHVEVYGRGPIPLVLVAGLACDWTVFRTFMVRNADRYTMYACTLPGFGGTEPPELLEDVPDREKNPWNIMLPNGLIALRLMIEEFGLDRPVVGGHGLGGHLALLFALDHPEMTRAVVAIDGLPAMELGMMEKHPTPQERRDHVERQVLRPMLDEDEQVFKTRMLGIARTTVIDKQRAEELAAMMNMPHRGVTMQYYIEYLISDASGRMKDLKRPLLMLLPIEPLPLSLSERRRKFGLELIGTPPHTTVVFIPECKHFVMDDAPLELDKLVDAFLQGQPVPGSFGVGHWDRPPGALPKGEPRAPEPAGAAKQGP